MNGRRGTPQSKHPSGPSSASKFRTPQHLNSTMLDQGNTSMRPARSGSASKPSRFHTNLDVTGIGNISTLPNIKNSLLYHKPSIDYELECDFAYSDYLQAFLKQEIVTNSLQKHEEDITDQLAIQKDDLYKSKLALQKANEELEELEMLDEVDDILNTVDENFDQFLSLSDDFDLSNTIEQLVELFSLFCSNVSVKNVKIFENQEDFDKLKTLLEKCLKACRKMNLDDRNVKEVNQLAEVIKKYQEKLQSVGQQQNCLNDLQHNEMYKLLKSLSDMYAAKGKC